MRKLLAILAVITFCVAANQFVACKSNTSSTESDSGNDSLQKVLERGKYLAYHVANCMDCHSKRDFTKYAAPMIPGTDGEGGMEFNNKMFNVIPGSVYAKNITPDPETGIGTWTDDEILRAMTQGISKNGDTLFPLMPYISFNRMAKSDLLSIIAFIKTLKPIKNKVPDRKLMVPMSMIYPANALQPSIDSNRIPPETDKVNYGRYLVTIADCSTCHTPFDKGNPDFSRAMAGGNTFNLPDYAVTSANITPDSASGIGTWTEERFMNKFLPYRKEEAYNFKPGKENTIMPLTYYAGMKDEDLKAIYAFLRTLKPIHNQVEKYPKK
ncbi:MAG: cytochrome c [Chitinophagaceae bacterium]|nr:cytochrome c [Chitinophagaceae bacterium]